MKSNMEVSKNKILPRITPIGGFIRGENDEGMVNHIPQRIPDIGILPENFRDPEYSLLIISKLTALLRKIVISKMDEPLVELTEKNKYAFVFLLDIIKVCSINQFEMYSMANEKDQLSILKEVKQSL